MQLDIAGIKNGDMELYPSVVFRAGNLLDVQLGSLTYAPEWGIDREYFFNPDFEIQNSSFYAYMLQKIAEWGMAAGNFEEIRKTLENKLSITFSAENGGNMIER